MGSSISNNYIPMANPITIPEGKIIHIPNNENIKILNNKLTHSIDNSEAITSYENKQNVILANIFFSIRKNMESLAIELLAKVDDNYLYAIDNENNTLLISACLKSMYYFSITYIKRLVKVNNLSVLNHINNNNCNATIAAIYNKMISIALKIIKLIQEKTNGDFKTIFKCTFTNEQKTLFLIAGCYIKNKYNIKENTYNHKILVRLLKYPELCFLDYVLYYKNDKNKKYGITTLEIFLKSEKDMTDIILIMLKTPELCNLNFVHRYDDNAFTIACKKKELK